jgi:N-acetylmuramic acid 6-phosphate etherase
VELLVVAAALEMALTRFLRENLTAADWSSLGITQHDGGDYQQLFGKLFAQLKKAAVVEALARATEFEAQIYRGPGLITYMTDDFLLDVLTDTTERSPTFMLPPFRKIDDTKSPRSWSFVKDPERETVQAWRHLLAREPRGLNWDGEVYKQLNAPAKLLDNPPRLDNREIYKFRIGREPDPSRTEAAQTALILVRVGPTSADSAEKVFRRYGGAYKKTALWYIGPERPPMPRTPVDEVFTITCDLESSPLYLWHHIAIKLVFNTISTATMALMGRVVGNAMIWLSPSNKKLIDRGSRLIAQLTGVGYDQACISLHEAIEEVDTRSRQGQEVPSPVALAIERLGLKDEQVNQYS